MNCDICNRINGHDHRCPNNQPVKTMHYCSFCGDGIFIGEKYIENSNGEYRHHDCFYGTKELLKWLGCKIKIMEEDN